MIKLLTLFVITFISFGLVAQSTNIIMDGATSGTTINSCQSTLFDSGGTGAGGPYGNNESITITVCPDVPGDFITIQWTIFALDNTNTSTVPNQSNADNFTIYDGDDATAPTLGTYRAGDITAGNVFGATVNNPTGCLTFVFNSNNTGTGDFSATLSCETPCDPPFADGIIVNADNLAGDSIAVCVNEIVTFQDNGSTAGASGLFTLQEWVWSWGDGPTVDTLPTGGPVNHTFSQPGQYSVQLTVVDDNGCVNLNATDIRVFVTTYPTFVPFPGDTTLCIGESVVLAAQPENYENTWTGFPLQFQDTDNCVSDVVGLVQPTPIPITGFDPAIQLDNANPDIFSICVDMEHSFMGDFVLQVQCPTGQIMTLHQQGGFGTDLGVPVTGGVIDCADPATYGTPWTYCFDATATDTWVQAVANGTTMPNANGGTSLIPGNYAPVDPLGFAALDGCPINGTWNLLFTDLWGGDDGSIPGWSINFDPVLSPPVTVFTPNLGAGSDSSYWDLSGQFIVNSSPDLDTITVTPLNAGSFDYTYFAINDFGCSFDSTVTITVDPLQLISAGPDVTVCGTNPVEIGPDSTSGGTCTYDLLLIDSFGDSWNGNTIDITTQTAGTFNSVGPPVDSLWIPLTVVSGEVLVLDFNNTGAFTFECEIQLFDSDGVLVYQDGLFGAPSNAPQVVSVNCYSGYTFDWTPTANIVTNPADQNPLVNPPTETTYYLTTYPNGRPLCSTTDSVLVRIGPQIDPGTDSTVNICIDGLPVDLIDFLGGTPQVNGFWIDAMNNILAMPVSPATLQPGIYEYRIDSLDCSLSAFLTVSIVDLPITITATDATCNSVADGSIDATSIMANSYSIDGGLTWQNATLFDDLLAGTYDVVVASGPNGGECQATTTVTIAEPNPLRIDEVSDVGTVCPGSTVALFATPDPLGGNGNFTLTWDNNIGVGQFVNFQPLQSTNVCVTLSEDCPSPTVTECIAITVPAPVDFDYNFITDEVSNKTTEGCFPHEFLIENLSTSTGSPLSPATDMSQVRTTWSVVNGSNFESVGNSNVFPTVNTPGIYDVAVTITTADDCVYENYLSEVITVWDRPDADFTYAPQEITMFNTEVTMEDLSEGSPIDWEWNFDGVPDPDFSKKQNPIIVYPEGKPGEFEISLKVWDDNLCTDSITKTLTILNDVNVFAPNMFTPDNDGFNDLWRLYITGIEVYDYHLTIYNRWGQPVFESFDPDGAWNGRYGNNGDIVLDGTYIWTLRAKDITEDKYHEFNGAITIAR